MDSLAGDVPVLAVAFDGVAPDRAGDPGRRRRWLIDEHRTLYRRLGMRRAPWWRVWSPATLTFYARAGGTAEHDGSPVDTRQMGGDAIVVDGVAVRRWLPRTPVDRVAAEVVVAAAREMRGDQTDSM